MKENMRLKAIVCGSTFGQLYMRAISMNDNLELVGIYAKGSMRSIDCSKVYNVPLFTDLDAIPDNIDIVFVVIKSGVLGGEGTEISKYFLKNGVNVMQEHPINHNEISECYKIARINNVFYKVGNLYPYLENIKKFCEASHYLNVHDTFLYGSVLSSSQGLYGLSSILTKSLNNPRNYTVEKLESIQRYPFNSIRISNGRSDVLIQVHNEVSDKDHNNHMHLLHRIIYFFNSGRLELNDTFGAVIWRSRMNISDAMAYQIGDKRTDTLMQMNLILTDEKVERYSYLLEKTFPESIKREIDEFIEEIINHKMNILDLQRELLISEKWSDLSKEIKFPKLVEFDVKYTNHIKGLNSLR